MAGGYLAIGSALSSLTKSQVIAFVVTAAVCFFFTVSGSSFLLGFLNGWAPAGVVRDISFFSFLTHFNAVIRGVIDLRDLVFFISVIVFFLFANAILVDLRKAD
jgi:gliding motility-associated transport system permease protein